MSDVDALLDDLDDEDDEETPTAARQDSSVINQLRRQLRDEKKARKAAEEKATTLEPFREKYLSSTAPNVFKEAGVDPSLVKIALRDIGDGDVTVETVTGWATENGIAVITPEPEEPTTQGSEGSFAPTVGGDGPGPRKVPRTTIDEMLRDPIRAPEAMTLIAQGKVEYESPEASAQARQRI